jgi:hypothetical protein
MRFHDDHVSKRLRNREARHCTRPQIDRDNAEIQRAAKESRRATRARRSNPALDDERPRYLQKRKIESDRRPVTEAKEVVGGYWIIQVKSREEALEWASRIPGKDNETVEVRRMFEITDFPVDIQEKFAKFEQQIAEGA